MQRMKFAVFAFPFILSLPAFSLHSTEDGSLHELTLSPRIDARDYGILFWRDSLRGRDEQKRKVLCVQTGYYAFALDVEKPALLRFGQIANALPYKDAGAHADELLKSVPESALTLCVRANGKEFRCTAGAVPLKLMESTHSEPGSIDLNSAENKKWNCRILEYGRCVQRFEIDKLKFESEDGETLPAAARLGFVCWPDRSVVSLDLSPTEALDDLGASISLNVDGRARGESMQAAACAAGEFRSVRCVIDFSGREQNPQTCTVTAFDDAKRALTVTFDPITASHRVELTTPKWNEATEAELDRLDCHTLTVCNPSACEQCVRLNLTKTKNFSGVLGALIQLSDKDGFPFGAPIQDAHNWASLDGARKGTPEIAPWFEADPVEFEPWIHAPVELHLPPHSTWTGRADVSYARWGGVPQASHYTLNLYGWGFFTPWEVTIVGNWGESNCPAIDSFGWADIHDMRPLYVQGMSPQANPKWLWTPNVGGARYLDYFDLSRHKMQLANRPAFLASGPCLTRALYRGTTEDRAVEYEIELMLPRTADINRTYHHIRYRVLRDMPFTKLAFFELGTPNYDYNSPKKIAYGNSGGLICEESNFKPGTADYYKRCVPLTGAAPWWVSLHDSKVVEVDTHNDSEKGNASRGLIVREWRARLGGQCVPAPALSFFGTRPSWPGMNAELSPPAGLTELKAGDFVDATLEVVLLPKHAEYYYGPDESLRKSLAATADKWQGVYRQACANHTAVSLEQGELVSCFPIDIRVDENDGAAFTLRGGLAYVPVSFSGLRSYRGYVLYEAIGSEARRVDQSVHGHDFWQTEFDAASGRYRITYNLPVENKEGCRPSHRYIFRRAHKPGNIF
ncbi:MAG TPA: hypothetical protein VKX17_19865 [Planctomycetota bacterium]|nr:hypothetical protein [Planctomycetota bacterium]